MMSSRILNKRTIVFSTVILFIFFIVYNSQSLTISTEDRTYLDLFLKRWQISQSPSEVHQSFDSEVAFISRVQDSVLAQVSGEQIPHRYFGNVGYYYTTGRGICYDKAALMEKVFDLYDFPTRHIYVYMGGDEKSVSASSFFGRHITSHALLEVKTQRGWMTVDTYNNLLGLTRNEQVLTIGQLRQRLQQGRLDLKKKLAGKTVFEQWGPQFRYIYGLWSRHGDFFTKAPPSASASLVTGSHVLPDYNLRMLLYNWGN